MDSAEANSMHCTLVQQGAMQETHEALIKQIHNIPKQYQREHSEDK